MRLVTWNNADRDHSISSAALAQLSPDIAVLPEWGDLPQTAPDGAASFVDFGTRGERGLGVASFGDWTVSKAEVEPIEGEVIGAVEVGGPMPFRLIAVWACLSGKPKVNPLSEALTAWSDWLADADVVVAGDFNTGAWWKDIKKGPMSHFPLVNQLGELGFQSAYHAFTGVEQGVDEAPTHWHSSGGSYMIDHVFTPTSWRLDDVQVGAEDPWKARSDHAPITVVTSSGAGS